jgi:serine/threonine-protein kinase
VGVVAAAQNLELDERVALKFLRPEMLAQPDVVARFKREAKAACSIKSEHVCPVFDVGTTSDGQPYLVMEFLEGRNLDAIVREAGHLGYREATEYVMQACEALAVAHARGIVHRDVKPENLFLTKRAGLNSVKVLDFGVSKTALTGSILGNAVPLVKTMNLMGSPCYMSPEQVRSADTVDARSDIWSLGIVLYEIVTGALPFAGSTITELCATILEMQPQPIATHRTDLPAAFSAVIDRCLEKDVTRRYQNVAELAIALMPFAPKRARISAERAAEALRSAGLLPESTAMLPTSAPPPPQPGDSASTVSVPRSSSPRLEGLQEGTTPGRTTGGQAESASPIAEAAPAPPAPKRNRGLIIGLALAAALAIVVGVLVSAKSSHPTPAVVTADPSSASSLSAVGSKPETRNPVQTTPSSPAVAEEPRAASATAVAPSTRGLPMNPMLGRPIGGPQHNVASSPSVRTAPGASSGPAKTSPKDRGLGYDLGY